ncbi:RNA polymerase factor sigma C [Jeotgalibacillus proteolyticus]|uniref:RNA polymerase factor sigma C n=2 Tax=Jeotgalibacillus proteolyticus TaxID=2082395 RepID=A0A2S5GE41_9BACL|nr:RNA polymerase factor sigma C [Jeotgalibacillus proteolyticus]
MEEFGTGVKRLIFSYVKDWNITSDLSQDVFITVYEKWDTFEKRSSFKTWVFSIAINKAKDYLKSWHYRKMLVKEPFAFMLTTTNHSPENTLLKRADQEDLVNRVVSLPVKYREVILLHYYQDLTFAEISEMLKIPVSTVKTRLHRAKEKIKRSHEAKERWGEHG